MHRLKAISNWRKKAMRKYFPITFERSLSLPHSHINIALNKSKSDISTFCNPLWFKMYGCFHREVFSALKCLLEGSIQTALAATVLPLSFASLVLFPKTSFLQPIREEHSPSILSSTLGGMITLHAKANFPGSQSYQYHFLSINPLQLLFSPPCC